MDSPNTIVSNNPDSELAKRTKDGVIDYSGLAQGQYFGRKGEVLGGQAAPVSSSPAIPPAGQSNATVYGPSTVPNRPVYGDTPATNTSSPYYSRVPATPADSLYSTEKSLVDSLTNIGAAPDKNAILEEKRKNAQALTDSIKEEFNRIIGDEQTAGAARADRVRALNVNSGLSGSDFASTNAQEDADKTAKIIEARNKEMNARVQAVLSGVDSQASDAYRAERDAYLQRAEGGINTIRAFQDRQKKTAEDNIKTLAASGTSYDDFKSQYPDQYQKLLDQSGLSETGAKALFIASKPAKTQVFSEKVGNQQIVGYRDPVTGKISTEKIDLPEEYDSFMVTTDGTPIFVNKSTGKATIATGFQEGQFAKPVDPADATYKELRNKNLLKQINKAPAGTAGRYTAGQIKELQQAGIDKAEQTTQDFYLNTPAAFRDEYTRNNATAPGDGSLDTIVSQYQQYVDKTKKKGVDSLL